MIDLLHVDLTGFLAGGANFLRTKIKSLIIIQIQEALIGENLTTLNPHLAAIKSFTFQKRSKESAPASEIMTTRNNKKPQKINMLLTTSQCKNKGKNHIC